MYTHISGPDDIWLFGDVYFLMANCRREWPALLANESHGHHSHVQHHIRLSCTYSKRAKPALNWRWLFVGSRCRRLARGLIRFGRNRCALPISFCICIIRLDFELFTFVHQPLLFRAGNCAAIRDASKSSTICPKRATFLLM